jgi:hypothetical protein
MCSFHNSSDYFQTGEVNRRYWNDVRRLDQIVEPLPLGKRAFVLIEGDVLADVMVPDDGFVVVYGGVRSSIQINGHGELIVAGDVLEGASISSQGIFHFFVGGDMAGCLRNRGSCTAWIEGHLRGPVWTGSPCTQLRMRGDCTATIRPSEEPSLLYLEVGGFMAYASLEATAAVGYTEFNASIGASDRPAGIYPDKTTYNALRQHRSYNRWVIRNSA